MKPSVDNLIRGTLFGQAVGDALGLGTEFMSMEEIARHCPEGLRDDAPIVQNRHRSRWTPGEWTDDTDQMVCILDSILGCGRVRIEAAPLSRHRRDEAQSPDRRVARRGERQKSKWS